MGNAQQRMDMDIDNGIESRGGDADTDSQNGRSRTSNKRARTEASMAAANQTRKKGHHTNKYLEIRLPDGVNLEEMVHFCIRLLNIRRHYCKSRKAKNILVNAMQILDSPDDLDFVNKKYRTGIAQTVFFCGTYEDFVDQTSKPEPCPKGTQTIESRVGERPGVATADANVQTFLKRTLAKSSQTDHENKEPWSGDADAQKRLLGKNKCAFADCTTQTETAEETHRTTSPQQQFPDSTNLNTVINVINTYLSPSKKLCRVGERTDEIAGTIGLAPTTTIQPDYAGFREPSAAADALLVTGDAEPASKEKRENEPPPPPPPIEQRLSLDYDVTQTNRVAPDDPRLVLKGRRPSLECPSVGVVRRASDVEVTRDARTTTSMEASSKPRLSRSSSAEGNGQRPVSPPNCPVIPLENPDMESKPSDPRINSSDSLVSPVDKRTVSAATAGKATKGSSRQAELAKRQKLKRQAQFHGPNKTVEGSEEEGKSDEDSLEPPSPPPLRRRLGPRTPPMPTKTPTQKVQVETPKAEPEEEAREWKQAVTSRSTPKMTEEEVDDWNHSSNSRSTARNPSPPRNSQPSALSFLEMRETRANEPSQKTIYSRLKTPYDVDVPTTTNFEKKYVSSPYSPSKMDEDSFSSEKAAATFQPPITAPPISILQEVPTKNLTNDEIPTSYSPFSSSSLPTYGAATTPERMPIPVVVSSVVHADPHPPPPQALPLPSQPINIISHLIVAEKEKSRQETSESSSSSSESSESSSESSESADSTPEKEIRKANEKRKRAKEKYERQKAEKRKAEKYERKEKYDKKSSSKHDKKSYDKYEKYDKYDKKFFNKYDKKVDKYDKYEKKEKYDKKYDKKVVTEKYDKKFFDKYDKRSDSYDKRSSSDAYDKRSSDNYDKAYDKRSADGYDKRTSDSYDKRDNHEKKSDSYDKKDSHEKSHDKKISLEVSDKKALMEFPEKKTPSLDKHDKKLVPSLPAPIVALVSVDKDTEKDKPEKKAAEKAPEVKKKTVEIFERRTLQHPTRKISVKAPRKIHGETPVMKPVQVLLKKPLVDYPVNVENETEAPEEPTPPAIVLEKPKELVNTSKADNTTIAAVTPESVPETLQVPISTSAADNILIKSPSNLDPRFKNSFMPEESLGALPKKDALAKLTESIFAKEQTEQPEPEDMQLSKSPVEDSAASPPLPPQLPMYEPPLPDEVPNYTPPLPTESPSHTPPLPPSKPPESPSHTPPLPPPIFSTADATMTTGEPSQGNFGNFYQNHPFGAFPASNGMDMSGFGGLSTNTATFSSSGMGMPTTTFAPSSFGDVSQMQNTLSGSMSMFPGMGSNAFGDPNQFGPYMGVPPPPPPPPSSQGTTDFSFLSNPPPNMFAGSMPPQPVPPVPTNGDFPFNQPPPGNFMSAGVPQPVPPPTSGSNTSDLAFLANQQSSSFIGPVLPANSSATDQSSSFIGPVIPPQPVPPPNSSAADFGAFMNATAGGFNSPLLPQPVPPVPCSTAADFATFMANQTNFNAPLLPQPVPAPNSSVPQPVPPPPTSVSGEFTFMGAPFQGHAFHDGLLPPPQPVPPPPSTNMTNEFTNFMNVIQPNQGNMVPQPVPPPPVPPPFLGGQTLGPFSMPPPPFPGKDAPGGGEYNPEGGFNFADQQQQMGNENARDGFGNGNPTNPQPDNPNQPGNEMFFNEANNYGGNRNARDNFGGNRNQPNFDNFNDNSFNKNNFGNQRGENKRGRGKEFRGRGRGSGKRDNSFNNKGASRDNSFNENPDFFPNQEMGGPGPFFGNNQGGVPDNFKNQMGPPEHFFQNNQGRGPDGFFNNNPNMPEGPPFFNQNMGGPDMPFFDNEGNPQGDFQPNFGNNPQFPGPPGGFGHRPPMMGGSSRGVPRFGDGTFRRGPRREFRGGRFRSPGNFNQRHSGPQFNDSGNNQRPPFESPNSDIVGYPSSFKYNNSGGGGGLGGGGASGPPGNRLTLLGENGILEQPFQPHQKRMQH